MKGRENNFFSRTLRILIPVLNKIDRRFKRIEGQLENFEEVVSESVVDERAKLYPNCRIRKSRIGKYTYVNERARISQTNIGSFCSIGPDFLCGWGVHPTEGISTHPMFYSTGKQVGITLSKENKIVERKPIDIGNDVFIGAKVTVLDGVTIGDGAVIGAGAVVSKDIPPYAIAIGVPIRIIRYRFDEETIQKLLKIQWWNFPDDQLPAVEKMFFDIKSFVNSYLPNK